ncbi:hypothetical protein [Spiroplasma ixodetis]|uniref:Uncharacterized protein n=1 Tax=Spiroplasma ixodetis TaxID=2141 RepID=A0ABN6SUV5_9MOLU|nr:hypothetical protein [Spiroplasma ixodetis]BDT02506.1 hypothetical protein SHM_01520 [Spiroplasma ixodetis]
MRLYLPTPSTPTDNYIYSDKKTIFNLGGDINRTTQTSIKLDELIIKDNVKVQLLFTKNGNDITVVSNDINYQASSVKLYQYIGKGKPTEFIAEDSIERDYYTKIETNNLLDKKQNKLIAGTNITIDENNKISASGGGSVDENRIFNNKEDKDKSTYLINNVLSEVSVNGLIYAQEPNMNNDNKIPNKKYVDDKIPNLDNYYKKEEVNKKLEDTKALFPIAFSMNAIGQEIPNLETTNKTIAGAINENKSNINKKQDKENWKIIGKSLDNRTWEDFALSFNKYYRVFITWEKPPFNQVNTKIKVEFKTGNYLGGNSGDKIFLTKGEIEGVEANLYLIVVKGNNWKLIINGGNKEYGNIFSLEELQNTIKVDITPKLKINSRSLETNEIEENIWDIELKNNPTPSPSKDNWKEVGTREKNQWDNWQITYNFIVNKRYRVYYSWNIYNPVFAIQEFIMAFLPLCTIFKSYHINAEKSLSTNFSPHF